MNVRRFEAAALAALLRSAARAASSRTLRLALPVAALLVAALVAVPRPPLKDGLNFSRAVYDRHGRLLRMTVTPEGKYRLWVPLSRISPVMVEAILLQEDRHFRRHPGVNPVSLFRAFRTTYLDGGRRMGGSTITMQLARLRYRIHSRTLRGKLEQIVRAFQLELHYSKDEILEAYLNLAPFGGNVEGVAAASRVYFGKGPERLTAEEAGTLSVIPQSPARRTPVLVAAAFHAPHFVEAALRDYPEPPELHTTLDLRQQALLERLAQAYVRRRRGQGIRNASALLVDWRSMEVRASLGSADYSDEGIQGQVNGTRARRSPGSALKPLIYALGFDQGLVHPLSLLKDAPTRFGGFNPENFDGDFAGPIRVREALIRSRNVPAVQTAQLLAPGLHGFLKAAGIPLREEAHYGLALVLGAAELTMEDLARLYAMLANRGELRPLRFLREEPRVEGSRLLSPEAAFMVLDILKDNPRPGQGYRAEWTRDPLPVHWKTGTSYGFRDAWSIAVFGPYVLAVWAGEFDGRGNPAFVGVEAAAPLMFELVDGLRALEPELKPLIHPGSLNLARVQVCAVSGGMPGPHCRRTAQAWFIPGVSPIKACEVHREVLVDGRSGRRACRRGPGVRSEVHEFWPSDILKLYRAAGVPRRVPPPDDPDCPLDEKSASGAPPVITSPQAGMVYTVGGGGGRGRGEEGKVPLTAVVDADARQLFWFVDERFVGKSASGEPLFWSPRPGTSVVRVVDDRGRSESRELRAAVNYGDTIPISRK